MPIPVTCSSCPAKMNAPDAAAGKKVKCPKCQQIITVPAPAAAPGFEVVEDEPAPKKPTVSVPAKPKSKAVVEIDDEEDEDEKPRKKKSAKAVVDDDDDDRPRKKRRAVAEDDEDDDDDRPRKKRKKQRAGEGGTSLVRNIVGGVVLLVLLGVVGYVYYDKFGKRDKDEPASNSKSNDTPRDPPAGPQRPDRPGPQSPGLNVQKPTKPLKIIRSIAASADGKQFALSGSADAGKNSAGLALVTASVRHWDVAGTGMELPSPSRTADFKLAYSPRGDILAGVNESAQLVFWNTESGEALRSADVPIPKYVQPASIEFMEDSSAVVVVSDETVATVRLDGTVIEKKPQALKGAKGEALGRLTRYVPGLKRMATLRWAGEGKSSELLTWDPLTAGAPTVLSIPGLKDRLPVAYSVSNNGKVLAVSYNESGKVGVSLFSASDGTSTSSLPPDDDPKFGGYRHLVLSSDGKYLAGIGSGRDLGSQFECCDLIRVADGKRLYRAGGSPVETGISNHTAPVFSGDGKWLFFGWNESQLKRIDTEKGSEVPLPSAP